MCCLALANLVWNEGLYVDSARFLVRFQTQRGDKLYYYDLRDIDYSTGKFTVAIKRSGGGQPCIMTAKIDHHEKVEMTHATQHVAGLVEQFKLRKEYIEDGEHKNSKKYGRFWGAIKRASKLIDLNCQVKSHDGRGFVTLPYTLTVDSYRLKNRV